MMLPWEYGFRNLARRPVRTLLTLVALTTVVVLVLIVVGFIRGLERSLVASGESDVVLISSVNSEENLETSAIEARTPDLIQASVKGVFQRFGVPYVSPELYMGTRVTTEDGLEGPGLVRGVTLQAPLVRRSVRLLEGSWPKSGEVIVGKLASAKIGLPDNAMKIGRRIEFEGREWIVSGRFSSGGAAYESEIWCPLPDFQTATQRQDLSLVAVALTPGTKATQLQLFCKERTDLELRAVSEPEYYARLQQHYRPVRYLAWSIVFLVAGAGIFAGLNMMYGAIAGRVREIATLQAIGFRRRAILLSLVQEGLLLALAASIIAGFLSTTLLSGKAVRFTMGAFELQIDGVAILWGCSIGLLIGVLGALPPALKALRESVAVTLKASQGN